MPGPSMHNRNRLRRSSTIQIDNFLHDEDDNQKFKAPKFQFQPLSTRYKQREEKKAKEEEEKFRQLQIKLKKKKEKEAAEAAEAKAAMASAAKADIVIVNDPEAEKAMKKAELEKVTELDLIFRECKKVILISKINFHLSAKFQSWQEESPRRFPITRRPRIKEGPG